MKKLRTHSLLMLVLLFSATIVVTSCGNSAEEKNATSKEADTIPQVTIKGINLPVRVHCDGITRVLNGKGVRRQYFMDIYVAGLYLEEKTNDPQVIINEDKAVSIRIQIISSMLTSEIMEAAIRRGIERSIKGDYEQYKDGVDMICGVFATEATNVGDVYEINYTPGIGISGSKNSKPYAFSNLGEDAQEKITKSPFLRQFLTTIKHNKEGNEALPGVWFRKAVLGVWFSDTPVDEQLKDSLLGIVEVTE